MILTKVNPLRLGSVLLLGLFCSYPVLAQPLRLTLRTQAPVTEGADQFHRHDRPEEWKPAQSAVIVCDMWDAHHSVNAVRRVHELSPRIDQFCRALRSRGVTIIHAPSSCMPAYEEHPARQRMLAIPSTSKYPDNIAAWCDQIPTEEAADYPLDQSDGGEDDDPLDHKLWAKQLAAQGRNPESPWLAQTPGVRIDQELDYISDSGTEIWNLLAAKGIQNVILVGVHTNMCVLGRPFGLRRLAAAGKHVVLARDLTDTMYNPAAWPFANHFTGTDLILDHIERYVCPTISSNQVLGGQPFRFSGDNRQNLVMLIAEDEYETETTLPQFARKHLSQSFRVVTCFGSETERHHIVGLGQAIHDADAVFVSVRRRALPIEDMKLLRAFVSRGKPVIGIRTASHAFSLRGKPAPENRSVWEDFDSQAFGGNYTGHYGNSLKSTLAVSPVAKSSGRIGLAARDALELQPGGSLYKAAPLAAGAFPILHGTIEGEPQQPVAWTFIRPDGGRSFYTSLGHRKDFAQVEFEALLSAGIHWACGLEAPELSDVKLQNQRYASGRGKQR